MKAVLPIWQQRMIARTRGVGDVKSRLQLARSMQIMLSHGHPGNLGAARILIELSKRLEGGNGNDAGFGRAPRAKLEFERSPSRGGFACADW